MIELTTSVLLLVSSLYGTNQTGNKIANTDHPVTTDRNQITVVDNSSSKTVSAVEAYVRKEYVDAPILIEIARCESRFHQFNEDGSVVRGEKNREDVGVMQINEHYHAEDAQNKGFDIYSLEGNVAFGKYLYDKYGTDPWKYSSKCWKSDDLAINKN